jgi:hypothetical protein
VALSTYQAFVDDLVRDDAARITPLARDAAVEQAVARLSALKPRRLIVEQTGVSGSRVAVPAGWVDGVSRLVAVEYPVGETPQVYVAPDRVSSVALPDGSDELAFVDALPDPSTIRTAFTAPHVVNSQADSVPLEDQWGVIALAASILCGQLASFYANQTDSTIAADGVDHKSKSELYAARERTYLTQAYATWGLDVPSAKTAGVGAAGTVISFAPRRGVKRWPVY